jgi:hypothetical protein
MKAGKPDPTAIDQIRLIDRFHRLCKEHRRDAHRDEAAFGVIIAALLLALIPVALPFEGLRPIAMLVAAIAGGVLVLSRKDHGRTVNELQDVVADLERHGYLVADDVIYDDAGRPIHWTDRGGSISRSA